MKKLLSFICILMLVVGIFPVSHFTIQETYAYTSTLNPHDPHTAPTNYIINIPDANLKKRLNEVIAVTRPVSTRAPDQDITVADARRVIAGFYGPT